MATTNDLKHSICEVIANPQTYLHVFPSNSTMISNNEKVSIKFFSHLVSVDTKCSQPA